MNELNQNLVENLGAFLMGFKEDVVRGLNEYLQLNPVLSLETI